MTDETPTESVERQARAWRDVGRRETYIRAATARGEVNDALATLASRIHEGEAITGDDVAAARSALDDARDFVEGVAAELSPEAEPGGAGAGQTVPHGVFADQLEAADWDVTRPSASEDGTGEEVR